MEQVYLNYYVYLHLNNSNQINRLSAESLRNGNPQWRKNKWCIYHVLFYLYFHHVRLIGVFTARSTNVCSAVLLSYVVCLSFCNVGGLWSD